MRTDLEEWQDRLNAEIVRHAGASEQNGTHAPHRRARVTRLAVDLKDLHEPWIAWCVSHGLTPSEAVRSALRAVLEREERMSAAPPDPKGASPSMSGDIRRVEMRLTLAEYAALSAAADRDGMSLPRWLGGLVRVHVTGEPELAPIEIGALSRSNQVLMALIQTIDKIARNEHRKAETDTLALAQIRYLSDFVQAHVNLISDLTTSNTQRWRR